MTPDQERRLALYQTGRWREALEEFPDWDDRILFALANPLKGGRRGRLRRDDAGKVVELASGEVLEPDTA